MSESHAPRPAADLAIGSIGTIGRAVATELARGGLDGYRLAAVSARDAGRAREFLTRIDVGDVPIVALGELAGYADLVLECAPPACYRELGEPAISAGKDLVTLSVGALLDCWDLVERAQHTGSTIYVPTGALLGLDAVAAARQGTIESIVMITRKPPAALAGSRYVLDHEIRLEHIVEPTVIFSGTVREAIKAFPSNVNVAVALALVSNGPDATNIEVWVDPNLSRNTHTIDVQSDSARLHMHIENVPSDNPATGLLTANSTIALLRKMRATLRLGT
jgi:aspartate dehydrogenase